MRRMAIALVVLVGVLSALIGWRLQARERQLRGPSGGSGEIEGTEVDVSSRLNARVARVLVRKGDEVRSGDLLVTLDCAEPQATLDEAVARLDASSAQLRGSLASIEATRRQGQAAVANSTAARAQAEALAAQRDAAARQASRLDALAADVALSNRDQVKASAEGLGHQVEAARAQAEASLEQARALEVSTRSYGAQAEAARSNMRAAEAAVKRAKLLVAECELRAPRDAVVSEVPREAGELATPGAVLVRLIDLKEVKATFYLPNAELAAVRPGARAHVVADAWPETTFEGAVTNVAVEAEFTPRNIQTRTDRDRLVYPVEVTLANADGRLRPGMPVQVSIPGTER